MKLHNSFINGVDLILQLWYTKYVVRSLLRKDMYYEF